MGATDPLWTVAQDATNRTNSGTAYLWIPPQAPAVRAVLLCVDNYAEAEFVRDPEVRAVLAQERIALLFMRPRLFGITFDVPAGDAEFLDSLLARLAGLSGHPEIRHAPLITLGHSAAAPWAMQMAYWNPSRVAGVVYYKSGSIAGYKPAWASSFAEVPLLAVIGELEEFGPDGMVPTGGSREQQWQAVRDDLVQLRASGHRVAQVVLPGEGHWAWSDAGRAVVCRFIKDVMATRVPAGQAARDGPVVLNVPSLESGWLMDADIKNAAKSATAAWGGYAGASAAAFWLPSGLLAAQIDSLHARFGRADQTITWNNRSGSALESDSISGSWDATRQVLTTSATASSGLPVKFKLLRGSAVQIAPDQFRVDAAHVGDSGFSNSLDILAYQEGDSHYRFADRMARASVTTRTGTFAVSPRLPRDWHGGPRHRSR